MMRTAVLLLAIAKKHLTVKGEIEVIGASGYDQPKDGGEVFGDYTTGEEASKNVPGFPETWKGGVEPPVPGSPEALAGSPTTVGSGGVSIGAVSGHPSGSFVAETSVTTPVDSGGVSNGAISSGGANCRPGEAVLKFTVNSGAEANGLINVQSVVSSGQSGRTQTFGLDETSAITVRRGPDTTRFLGVGWWKKATASTAAATFKGYDVTSTGAQTFATSLNGASQGDIFSIVGRGAGTWNGQEKTTVVSAIQSRLSGGVLSKPLDAFATQGTPFCLIARVGGEMLRQASGNSAVCDIPKVCGNGASGFAPVTPELSTSGTQTVPSKNQPAGVTGGSNGIGGFSGASVAPLRPSNQIDSSLTPGLTGGSNGIGGIPTHSGTSFGARPSNDIDSLAPGSEFSLSAGLSGDGGTGGISGSGIGGPLSNIHSLAGETGGNSFVRPGISIASSVGDSSFTGGGSSGASCNDVQYCDRCNSGVCEDECVYFLQV